MVYGAGHPRCETTLGVSQATTTTAEVLSLREKIAAAQCKRRQSPSIVAAKFFPRDFFYNKGNPAQASGEVSLRQATLSSMCGQDHFHEFNNALLVPLTQQ